MNIDIETILKNNKFRSFLHTEINKILSNGMHYLNGLNIVTSFRCSDISAMMNDEKIQLTPSFPSYEEIILWSKNNNFQINGDIKKGATTLSGNATHTNSISLIYCRKNYKSYRKINIDYVKNILSQAYPTKDSLIGAYDSLIHITKEIRNAQHIKNKNNKFKESLDDLEKSLENMVIRFNKNKKEPSKDKDFDMLKILIDADHVKCKCTAKEDEWLLMFPCYSWVNRMIGRSFEKKLGKKKLILSDIGEFNALELMKIFSPAIPQDQENLEKISSAIANMCSSSDKNKKTNIETEIMRVFSLSTPLKK